MEKQRPPKSVTDQLRRQGLGRTAPEVSLQAFQADLVEASPSLAGMPVLEAFQTFLEAERRQARTRLRFTLLTCGGLIALVIGVGVLLSLWHVEHGAVVQREMQGQINAFAAKATGKQQQLESMAGKAIDASTASRNAVTQEADARLDADKKMAGYLKMQTRNLETMEGRVTELQGENTKLRGDVDRLLGRISEMVAVQEGLARQVAAQRLPEPGNPGSTTAARPVVTAAGLSPTSDSGATLRLNVESADGSHRTPWRIPLP